MIPTGIPVHTSAQQTGSSTAAAEQGMSDTESDEGPETLLKLIFVGDSGVGKSALIERMFSNRFDPQLPATIGTDQRFKRLRVDGVNIGVSVWDTAGQDRFQSLTPMYYRGAQGVVYVYDVTNPASLENLGGRWMQDFKQYGRPDAIQMVVGNKIDLGEAVRAVSPDQGAAFARDHGCLYKETSAKTDKGGVDEGVYDALVWGMVCTILDTPGLASHGAGGGGQSLELAERRRHGGVRPGCC